jgi:hypothetical protein
VSLPGRGDWLRTRFQGLRADAWVVTVIRRSYIYIT